MTNRTIFLFMMFNTIGLSLAAPPVATVSSSGAFSLRGANVQTEGIPSWPLLAGDEIRTSSAPALVQFRDGSRITLAENSRARLEKTSNGLAFRVVSGAGQFTLSPTTNLKIYSGDKLIPASAGVATATLRSPINAMRPMLTGPPRPISGR